ncbi:MAG: polysaccharide biosynthesis/export family protein [Methylococcales bacterium]
MNDFSRFLILDFRWLTISLVIGVSGCGTQQAAIPNNLNFIKPNVVSPPSTQYRIKPGDQLDIKFFYNPELNENLLVRPDSKIALQLIGDIDAAGHTVSELTAVLKERYSTYLQNPTVTVIVRGFIGQQVFVDGEVGHPGSVDIASGLTAWQAIIKAGGFIDTATRESVIVIRQGEDNQPVPYRLDLKSTSLDQPNVAFPLKPYDIVFVPKTWIAEADKFVLQYVEKLLLYKGMYINISPIAPFIK